MEDIELCRWSDINEIAENVFNILLPRGDLAWAKKAWHILEDTSLCAYAGKQGYYRVLVRLFCLGELYYRYNEIACEESFDSEYKYYEWVTESDLQQVRFIMLAGEGFYDDEYIGDSFSEVISHLIGDEYQRVVDALVEGFGGRNGLMASLIDSPTFQTEEEAESYDDAIAETSGVCHSSTTTYLLVEWKLDGFPRR